MRGITAGIAGRGMKTLSYISAMVVAVAIGATLRADELAITPTTLPDGMEGVGYSQFFTATGGSESYSWYTVPATWRAAECTYAVTANETPQRQTQGDDRQRHRRHG